MITLDQAKQLVCLLEDGQQTEANALMQMIIAETREPMYEEVGKITRQLHDSLTHFRLDPRLNDLATNEIPDARDRLSFVIDKTEAAANKTMDAVESLLPIADQLHEILLQVRPQWQRLMDGEINLAEFKLLCHDIDKLLMQVEGDSSEVRSQLTEILMAQDFQDLTGQIIRRVIALVQEVEERLIEILKAFGLEEQGPMSEAQQVERALRAEGPIVNTEKHDNVMSSQDDVDDLLSSLGF